MKTEDSSQKYTLSEEQKQKFQQKISHYLKGYRLRNNLTGEDLAGIMGLSIATFRALEGSKPAGRMVNSLDFLASLYSLEEGMSLADFAIYLDSSERGTVSEGSSLHRKLFPWEKHLLGAFDKLGMLLRREFVNDICINEPLEKYVELILKLKKLDDSEFKVIEDMVDTILKFKDISVEDPGG